MKTASLKVVKVIEKVVAGSMAEEERSLNQTKTGMPSTTAKKLKTTTRKN
jgi:hypothetical protein